MKKKVIQHLVKVMLIHHFFICSLLGLYSSKELYANEAITSVALFSQEITFVDANPTDAEFLTQLAIDSNAVYGYRNASTEVIRRVFLVHNDNFTSGIVRMMKLDNEVIGFFTLRPIITPNGTRMNRLGHLFLRADMMQKGYGRKLFEEAMKVAKNELGWKRVYWESDPNAASFYEYMGAVKIGEKPCVLNKKYKAPIFCYILFDN